MTTNRSTLTDPLLRQGLSELAAGPDASALIDDVLRIVDETSQAGAPLLSRERFGTPRPALVAATILLLTALVGAAVVLSGRIPAPEPIPVPDDAFFPHFTYSIPPDSGLQLLSVVRRNELHFDADDPAIFGDGRGVVVVSIVPGLLAHGCERPRVQISETSPAELVNDLRVRAGFGLGPPTPSTIDGLPAVVTDLAYGNGQCAMTDLHLKEGTGGLLGEGLMLEDGAKIFVVDANGTLVLIEVWAASIDKMDPWLPTAIEFVNGIHFTSEEGE